MKIEFNEKRKMVYIDEIKSAHLLISRPLKNLPKRLNIQTDSLIISINLNRRNIKQLKDQLKQMEEMDLDDRLIIWR